MEGDFSRKVGSLFVFLLLTTSLAFGQGIVTGAISGTVVDQQQAVISGAKITAEDVGTGTKTSTTTGATGAFTLRALPVGTYNVSIEATGFSQLRIRNVAVSAGKEIALGSRMLTIGAAEVVNVESAPPLVEASTSQVSTNFSGRKASDLPIGTGFDTLALLVPGIASVGDNDFSNTNGVGLSSNGQRGRSNNFQIDGQSNNDNSVAGPSFFFGNQDAIGEIQVVSNNFQAEYGRNMGSVVNYVTKSGTNSLHGTVFYFHTNSVTDSLRNQDKSPLLGNCRPGQDPDPDGIPLTDDECNVPRKPKYIDNRGGFTLGGPVMKDKLWFFGSYMYEHAAAENLSNSKTIPGITPTPAGLAMLAATYCGGVVPACPSHPGLGALLTNGPYALSTGNPRIGSSSSLINVTDGVTPLAAVPFSSVERRIPDPFNDHEFTARVDWMVGSKDRFFARYVFQQVDFGVTGRVAAGAWVDVPGRTQQIGVDWVRNWSSNLVNQFRFSYSRAKFSFTGGANPACDVATPQECSTGINLPFGFLDFGQQNNLPQDRLVNNSQWQDNVQWVIGKHTVKFGGEYARQRSPNNFLPNQNGTFNFPSSQGFNGLLRNIASSLSLTQGNTLFNFKEQDAAFYFQDDWKVKDNLTLQLGLRWEFTQQAINLLHDLTVARESDPATAFWDPNLPLEFTTFPSIPNDTNNFSPYFGFAWTPRFWEGFFGKDKTVLRGGYRIAYDPAFYNIFSNVATAAPIVNAASLSSSLCTTTCRQVPAGTTYNGTEIQAARLPFMPTGCATSDCDPRRRTQTNVTPDFHNPYTQQWSLSLQREITPKIAFEVRYAGNHTVGNFQTINGNPSIGTGAFGCFAATCTGLEVDFPSLIPAGVSSCSDPTAAGFAEGRIDCDHRLLRTRANTAFSIYHGLQARLDLQNWHGLTGGVGYTFSRTIDNVSEIFSTFAGGNTIAGSMNPFDANRGERGVSGISFPHVLTTYWIYDLPMYKSQQGFAGHLLGGWQINGVYRYSSGQPVSIAQGFWSTYCDANFYLTFYGADTCRPILSNPSAPLDTVGICSDETAPDCGLLDFYTVDTVSASDVHWIVNDDVAALFFGDPFLGAGRNTLRGQTINNMDFGVFKNTKITEKLTLQFQWNAFNILNRQFRGVLDTFVDDCPFRGGDGGGFSGCAPNVDDPTPVRGTFGNNFQNTSNRRRMTFGMKLIF